MQPGRGAFVTLTCSGTASAGHISITILQVVGNYQCADINVFRVRHNFSCLRKQYNNISCEREQPHTENVYHPHTRPVSSVSTRPPNLSLPRAVSRLRRG